MKRLQILIFSLLCALSLKAQVKQEVIASAGGYKVSSGMSLSWTLGETIVPTFSSQDGTLVLTHGFQQQLIITAIEENIDVAVDVKVFPNPASDVINISFENPVEGEISITLLDSNGKLVKKDIAGESIWEMQINLQDVPSGIYYLRLVKGKFVNVYKVVKL
jgi:hypothetical protein